MEREKERVRSSGGWVPVIYRKYRHCMSSSSRLGAEQITLFVEHLPWSMSPKGLFSLFSKFGVVKDVYIPNKTKKATSTRFGFVRYNCLVAADVAVQKANGLWVDNMSIFVKKADYQKNSGSKEFQPKIKAVAGNEVAGHKFVHMTDRPVRGALGKSYADVVKGGGEDGLVVMGNEEGNGWLYKSVIVKLKMGCDFLDFENIVHLIGSEDIVVRRGRGKDVVLTFKLVEDMKVRMEQLDVCLKEWCCSVMEWRRGLVLDQKRTVWLCCYGVPLNLWNVNTFKSIGKLWSEVVSIADETSCMKSFECRKVRLLTKHIGLINNVVNLSCRGAIFPVWVAEEQVVVTKLVTELCKCMLHLRHDDCSSNKEALHGSADGVLEDGNDDEVAVDMDGLGDNLKEVVELGRSNEIMESDMALRDGLVSTSMVEETSFSGLGNSNVVQACRVETAGTSNCIINGHLGNDSNAGQIFGPGACVSQFSKPEERIEVVVDLAQYVGPNPEPSPIASNVGSVGPKGVKQGMDQEPIMEEKHRSEVPNWNRQWGRNSRNQICRRVRKRAKLNPEKRRLVRRMARGARYVRKAYPLPIGSWHRGALFRAASLALSASSSSGIRTSRDCRFQQEAQAVVQLGKVLELNCNGAEAEVLQQCVELERVDEDRATQRVGTAS